MRKLLLSLLAVSLLPQTAFCADGDVFNSNSIEGVSIQFKVISESAKTCKVYATYTSQAVDNSYEGPLTIPAEANGYTVVDMDGGAFYHCNITSVVLPNTMTEWGSEYDYKYGSGYSDFFSECSKLSSVTIPEGITAIGRDAFGSSALTSVVIPSTVKNIWSGAFCASGDASPRVTSIVFDNCYPQFLTDNSDVKNKPFTCYYASMSGENNVYYPAAGYYLYTHSAELSGATLHPQIHITTEWATFCATGNFEVPDGIDAYVVKSYGEGVVTLQKVTTINAGQGVLLKPASVGTFYDATVCSSAPDAYESNMLKGVTSTTAINATDGEFTNFIFTKVGDEIGFYPAKAGKMPAYKAYLQIPTASLPSGASARLSVIIEGEETTTVEKIKTNVTTDANWHTIDGVQIEKPSKSGLYIHEGKKVIIK